MTNNKEEILDKNAAPYSCRHVGRYRESALSAMDEYAKQVAIEFKTFVSDYMNGNVTDDEPDKDISDDNLYSLWEQTKK